MRPFAPLPVLLLLVGCNEAAVTEPPVQSPTPPEWNRQVTKPNDAEASAGRASCQYLAGSLPAETQGSSYPSGDEIPIDHILVVMMENRSFDHYFQKLPEYLQSRGITGMDVDVAPDDFSNPDPDGNPIPIYHQTSHCFVDTDHSWRGTHEQIGGGQMSGFVTTNEGNHELPVHGDLSMLAGDRAMGYYDATDIPFYYWLASEFAVGDRYFSSLPGPTMPNRLHLYAATSFGAVHNGIPPDANTLIDYLDLRQISWKIYASASPGMGVFFNKVDNILDHKATLDDYFADAAAGKLPQFAFVDPSIGINTGTPDNNDEHPPALAHIGQRFVAEVVDALVRSPNWSRSAMFLTYDEHGGLYDHVEPPAACPPDDISPILENGDPDKPLNRLGIRVPFVVVSPYAKKHYVGHEVYDHTSIVRFVEARYVMPALTNRDANALAPWDMFDFSTAPHADPPTVELPTIPQADLDACKAIYN